jgi:hypothetical protein
MAPSNGAVTVNGITVERTGLGQDAVFSGVVLLDENGNQVGISKTLNSNHQAVIGETITIPAGQTRTFTVAGNMSATLDSYAGQVVGLSVVGVQTSAAVSGSLPVTGAMHTVNASLSLGTATLAVSSFDPNTSSTKEIGTTGFRFAGIRVTAGSAEKVRLMSIRWNQTGSAGSSDLSNVKVVVDSTEYPTTVSADGKYYTANFGSGIVLDKGFSKDVYIKADVMGSGAAGRTVRFDIYKNTDIYLVGETYGYGLIATAGSTATASDSSSEFTTGSPFFHGSLVTISAGSVTTINKANSVAAQNIAVNVPNQPLGGFEIDVKGESISVQNLAISVATSSTGAGLLTNVSIVDENGSVVAGPIDASGAGTTLTFSDTITFPVGKHVYTVKGRLPSTFTSGGTITLSTNPSTQWSNVTGQTTGNTISLPNTTVTMNTMTVKGAALAISIASTPAAQTITAGAQDVVFSRVQLDATASGEDVRFSTIPLIFTFAGTPNYISGCQLFDGTASSSVALNSGSNIVNPSSSLASGSSVTFTFDNSLTVAKGTIKTLDLRCDVSSSATTSSTYKFGISASPSVTVTGVTSSNEVTETVTASNGQTMTIGSAGFTVTKDASSPAYTVVAGGTQNVTVGVLEFRSTNEELTLEQVALQLTNTASSSAASIERVSLWNGATEVASGQFLGSAATTILYMSGSKPIIPKDGQVDLTVKVDLADIGTGQATSSSGAFVAVDYDGGAAADTEATGSSGRIDSSSTSDTDTAGVRVMNSYPTFAKINLDTTTLSNGERVLARFRVTANSKDSVGIYKFTTSFATTTASVKDINVYAYTDSSFSTTASTPAGNGQFDSSDVDPIVGGVAEIYVENTSGATSTAFQVPAGESRWFEVRGTVTGSASGAAITTTVEGDAAYPSLATLMSKAGTIDADTNDDFIWSPNSTSTSAFSSNDWTNGYGIPGLPASGLQQTVAQ